MQFYHFVVILCFGLLVRANHTHREDAKFQTGAQSANLENVIPTNLGEVLNFYNSKSLSAIWPRFKQNVSRDCQKDMDIYIVALRNADRWALKSKYSFGYIELEYCLETAPL